MIASIVRPLERGEIDALPSLDPWNHLAPNVFVGGCIDGRRSFRRKAHAHIEGEYQGWICVRSIRRLQCRLLMLHELAHILTREGHTDTFRSAFLSLGGKLDAHHCGGLSDLHKTANRKHHPRCPCKITAPKPELVRPCCGSLA